MTMTMSYHIEAPVESVFDYFKNPASDIGAPGVKVLESRTTKEGVGTYAIWQMRIAGIPWHGMEVITDCTPNKHLTEKSSSPLVGTWDYTFEPEGSGTKVTMVVRPRSLWSVPPLRNLIDFGRVRLSGAFIRRTKAKLESESSAPSTARTAAAKPRKRPAGR